MFIKIRLLQGVVPTTKIIPDPLDIFNAVVETLDPNHPSYQSTYRWLENTTPCFYVPDHSVDGSIAKLETNNIVVFYKSTTVRTNVEFVMSSITSANQYAGQTASYSAHHDYEEIDVVPNCFAYKTGVERLLPRGGSVHYLLNQPIPKAEVSFKAPQTITLKVSPAFDISLAPNLLNSFHKLLVSKFPFNSQTTGSHGNEFTSEEESIFYRFNSTDDIISEISLTCLTGISDEISNIFAETLVGCFFQSQTEYKFDLKSNEYFVAGNSTHFKSITPAFSTGKIKDTGNLKLTPSGSFLQSVNHILNHAKTAPELFYEGEWICGRIGTAGLVKVRTRAVEAPYRAKRGGRRALSDQAYEVEVITEHPINLLAIGSARKFGCGQLINL